MNDEWKFDAEAASMAALVHVMTYEGSQFSDEQKAEARAQVDRLMAIATGIPVSYVSGAEVLTQVVAMTRAAQEALPPQRRFVCYRCGGPYRMNADPEGPAGCTVKIYPSCTMRAKVMLMIPEEPSKDPP